MEITNGEILGWTGAILGILGGIAGGAIGTYFSIKNTNGPRERQFMVRCALGIVIFVGSYLAILFLTPVALRWLIALPYVMLLLFIIRKLNARQMAIRESEAGRKEA